MLWRRLFFRVGAATWITGGIGHFVLIDALTLHGRTRVSEWAPHGDLLATMEKTTLNFGVLGSTTAFLATAGFSAWVAFSLTLLGIIYVLLARQDGLALRPFTRLGIVVSATFSAVAAVCFIFPATMGGVVATALFAVSLIRKED
jgi:hypothetical protein